MYILQMTTRHYGHITHDYQELCSAMWLEVVAISGYIKGDLPSVAEALAWSQLRARVELSWS